MLLIGPFLVRNVDISCIYWLILHHHQEPDIQHELLPAKLIQVLSNILDKSTSAQVEAGIAKCFFHERHLALLWEKHTCDE